MLAHRVKKSILREVNESIINIISEPVEEKAKDAGDQI